jgi:DNA-binding Lrp family transcriptional regulator
MVDQLDFKILKELEINARASYVDIEKILTAPSSVREKNSETRGEPNNHKLH